MVIKAETGLGRSAFLLKRMKQASGRRSSADAENICARAGSCLADCTGVLRPDCIWGTVQLLPLLPASHLSVPTWFHLLMALWQPHIQSFQLCNPAGQGVFLGSPSSTAPLPSQQVWPLQWGYALSQEGRVAGRKEAMVAIPSILLPVNS